MNGIEIPDKRYFKIGEVARLLDLEPYVLRYWETEFDVLDPQKTRSGQRSYRREDIEILVTIRHLLYEEMFTIAGARRQLKLRREGEVSIFDAVEGAGAGQADAALDVDAEAVAAAEELAETLKAELAEVRGELEERESTIERLEREAEGLRGALDDARDAAAQARQAAESAKQGDLLASTRQSELEAELAAAQQAVERLEAERAAALEQVAAGAGRREALASLRSQLEGLARATAALH